MANFFCKIRRKLRKALNLGKIFFVKSAGTPVRLLGATTRLGNFIYNAIITHMLISNKPTYNWVKDPVMLAFLHHQDISPSRSFSAFCMECGLDIYTHNKPSNPPTTPYNIINVRKFQLATLKYGI